MPKGEYQDADIAGMLAILHGGPGSPEVDSARLQSELIDLFVAIGLTSNDDEFTANFQVWASVEPGHAELARQYAEVSEAKSPTEHLSEWVKPSIWALSRTWWGPAGRLGDNPTWAEIESHPAMLREIAAHLRDFHLRFVRRGPKAKTKFETAVVGLAAIYDSLTAPGAGARRKGSEVPHAVESQFVKFAEIALRPFFPATEATRSAISHCWLRMKTGLSGTPNRADS